MSRGIGIRQRLFLAAMYKLELEWGEPGAWVWRIVNAAGELGLNDEATAHKARKDTAREAGEAWWRQKKLETHALAEAGDPIAKEQSSALRLLEAAARSAPPRIPWLGPPQLRTAVDADEFANPTRTLGLLEKRGLIWRHAVRGRGASACLTDAGRVIGQQALEDLAKASPTPVETA